MNSFLNRILRAAKLELNLYEEVEADRGALGQAMGVVILSNLANGLGTMGRAGMAGILIGTISALIG